MSVAIDAETALNDPEISDAISPELCTTPVIPAPPPLNEPADKPLSTDNVSNMAFEPLTIIFFQPFVYY